MLRRNQEEEEQTERKNVYRARSFATAMKAIESLKEPIRSLEAVQNLKGVGPGIRRRIQLFLEASGDSVPKLDPETLAHRREERVILAELEAVQGIGPVKARKLLEAGCTSVGDLQSPEFDKLLTTPQRHGARYHEHLKQGVSREEVESLARYIRSSLPSSFEIVLGGSFRRGADKSSDIDVLIFHPNHVFVPFPDPPAPSKDPARKRRTNGKSTETLLQSEVIPALDSRHIIADTISSGQFRWQGYVVIPDGEHADRYERMDALRVGNVAIRRLDLNLFAKRSRGSALLTLTGDTDFNRGLRVRATKLGYHLNEFGLWRWHTLSKNGDPPPDPESSAARADAADGYWELINAETEVDVMDALDMTYVKPEMRNYGLLDNVRRSSSSSRAMRRS